MNPVPRILQAEPFITKANRQTLEKVSRLLDLLDSAIDFSVLAKQDWYQTYYSSDPTVVAIGASRKDLHEAITLYNSLS